MNNSSNIDDKERPKNLRKQSINGDPAQPVHDFGHGPEKQLRLFSFSDVPGSLPPGSLPPVFQPKK